MNYELAKDYYKRGMIAFFNSVTSKEPQETKGYLQQAISMFELSFNEGYSKAKDTEMFMRSKLKSIQIIPG